MSQQSPPDERVCAVCANFTDEKLMEDCNRCDYCDGGSLFDLAGEYAAAPDLADALEYYFHHNFSEPHTEKMIAAARAALKRAGK